MRQELARRRDPAGYPTDPVGYIRDVLGITLWHKMEEIARACLEPPHRVLVRTGHSVGKTMLAGAMTNWHFDSFDPSLTITTAPTDRDVKDLLWKEVRGQRQRAGLAANFTGTAAAEMRTSHDHYAKGYTSSTGESFQGRHDRRMLFIFDEAAGVESIYWTTTKSMWKPQPGHIWLAILNPTDTTTQAYLEDQGGKWRTFSLSCLDHPNIAAELRGEPAPIPAAVSRSQVEGWVNDWCTRITAAEALATDICWPPLKPGQPPEEGNWYRPGPLFESRCLGRWPSLGTYGVWSDSLWQASCTDNGQPRVHPVPIGDLPEIGCFVAGTLVDTENGPVPIEDIKVGDKVLTRQGYNLVGAAACTGTKPTVTVTCEDGRTLTGTADHPIWCGNGWRALDSLTNHDKIYAWKASNTMASLGAENRKRTRRGTAITLGAVFQGKVAGPGGKVTHYIDMSGRRSTARFRRGCAFITKTRTRRTTTFPISNALPNLSTARTIPTTCELLELIHAKFAEWNIGTLQFLPGFVPTSADALGVGETASIASGVSVRNAAPRSHVISTSLPKLVPVRVLTKSHGRQEKVYNLSVLGCPEYFANGILVHNCDVARFGDDNTALHVRWGDTSLHAESVNGWKTTQTTGRLIELAREFAALVNQMRKAQNRGPEVRPEDLPIKVDDDGVGGGVTDRLGEQGYNAIPIRAGQASIHQSRYPNKRSELWFATAERARAGRLALGRLDTDTLSRLKSQAMAVTWEQNSSGQRVVEKKDVTKEKIGRSPDDMDAMNLAYFESTLWEAPMVLPPPAEARPVAGTKAWMEEREERPGRRKLFGR